MGDVLPVLLGTIGVVTAATAIGYAGWQCVRIALPAKTSVAKLEAPRLRTGHWSQPRKGRPWWRAKKLRAKPRPVLEPTIVYLPVPVPVVDPGAPVRKRRVPCKGKAHRGSDASRQYALVRCEVCGKSVWRGGQ